MLGRGTETHQLRPAEFVSRHILQAHPAQPVAADLTATIAWNSSTSVHAVAEGSVTLTSLLVALLVGQQKAMCHAVQLPTGKNNLRYQSALLPATVQHSGHP